MANVTMQKARKEYVCYKCNKKIQKGEIYKKITAMYSKPKIVCFDCKIPRSELTSSEYLAWLYDLQDTFQINSPDDVQELIDEFENQKSELEEKYDNIPEQFQDGEVAEMLQERIDALEDAISDLEQIDFDEEEEEPDSDSQEQEEDKLEEARKILLSIE